MRNWRNTSSIRSIFVPLNANIPGIPTVVNVITIRLVPNFSSPLGKPPDLPNSRLLWNEPRPKTKRGKNGFHDYPIALPGSCFFFFRKPQKHTQQNNPFWNIPLLGACCFFDYGTSLKRVTAFFFSKQNLNLGCWYWYCWKLFWSTVITWLLVLGSIYRTLEYTEFPGKQFLAATLHFFLLIQKHISHNSSGCSIASMNATLICTSFLWLLYIYMI